MVEKWLPVVGFEGLYEVSDQGRVRSLDRVAVNSKGVTRHTKGRVLKLTTSPDGYQTLTLSKQSECISRAAHRMVMESFVGPRPERMVVRHLNGDPSDNRIANLAYGTYRDNALDMIAHGRCPQSNKTHCKRKHELKGWCLIQVKNGRRCRRCEYERMGVIWTGERQRSPRKETTTGGP